MIGWLGPSIFWILFVMFALALVHGAGSLLIFMNPNSNRRDAALQIGLVGGWVVVATLASAMAYWLPYSGLLPPTVH